MCVEKVPNLNMHYVNLVLKVMAALGYRLETFISHAKLQTCLMAMESCT